MNFFFFAAGGGEEGEAGDAGRQTIDETVLFARPSSLRGLLYSHHRGFLRESSFFDAKPTLSFGANKYY